MKILDKKLFISSGFDQVNLNWIIPVINDFMKFRKIDTIVFESPLDLKKINNNPKLKKILKDYKKIFFKKNFFMSIIFFFINFFKILKFINLIFSNKIILHKNWEDTQMLHSIWDSAKLNLLEKEYKASNFNLFYSIFRTFYKYSVFLNNQKKYKFKTIFLSHSVYHYRAYMVAARKLNLEIFNSGFFNLHRQKKNYDISWWNVDKKNLNKILRSINNTETNKYFENREKGKSNYTDATISNFYFEKKFLYPENIIFLHIFKDSPFNMIDKKRIFNDYVDWIINTIKIINQSDERWSFRLHPSCKEWGENQKYIISKMINKYSRNKKNIFIDDNFVPIKHIFKYAKRCVTFSGTIHLESSAYGVKPIIISDAMLCKFDSNLFLKPKSINEYKYLLLEDSNSNVFKLTQEKRLFAKKLIFVREKALLLKSEFDIDFIYRRDVKNIKKINKILKKSNIKLKNNRKFVGQLALLLNNKFSHTLTKRFTRLFL